MASTWSSKWSLVRCEGGVCVEGDGPGEKRGEMRRGGA